MIMKLMKKYILLYLLLIFASYAFGQTEKLLVPSDLKQQTIVTEPVTLRKGYFRAGLLLDYMVADRFFDSAGHKEYHRASLWGSKTAYGITFQYGITDRLQVDLVSEYLYSRQETQITEIIAITNSKIVTEIKQRGLGLGDSHVSFRYQFIPEKEKKFSLTGHLKATFPTGKKNPANIISENQYDLPVGNGTYALGFNIYARKIVYPYSFSAFTSFTHNFKGTKIFSVLNDIEEEFRMGDIIEAGLCGNLHLNEWIVFGNQINFYSKRQGEIENTPSAILPASWAFSYEPGLVFQVHKFRLGEAVRIPLKGKNAAADPLYVMMVQYIF